MRQAAVLYLEEKQDRNGPADGSVPMEVETRLLALEKGKGKGKGKKGKGKNKDGKDGSKGKYKTKDKGKGKGDGKDGKSSVKFEGYCNGCWKWGHRFSDCWANPKAKQLTVLGGTENYVG